MYGGGGAIFASENPIFQSKNRFLAVFAPGNPSGFQQKLERVVEAGELASPSTSLSKYYFDKLRSIFPHGEDAPLLLPASVLLKFSDSRALEIEFGWTAASSRSLGIYSSRRSAFPKGEDAPFGQDWDRKAGFASRTESENRLFKSANASRTDAGMSTWVMNRLPRGPYPLSSSVRRGISPISRVM